MVSELATLIHLQEYDSRLASLEAELARLPRDIQALEAALAEARKRVEAAKARLEQTRRELRTRERDLDDIAAKRARAEARLWEVKTNVEYSAVLAEIETIKAQKARTEEEILALMERQEALAHEAQEAERRFEADQERCRRETGALRERMQAVTRELELARAERAALARELPPTVLADYERILRARGGLAVAPVTPTQVCGGCRVAVRPQAVQELRAGQALLHCESCGRFIYWRD